MAIKTTIESIELNGGENLIKHDESIIRKALSTTDFVYDDFLWVTKDTCLSILDWLNYEVDTVLSASVLVPFVEKQLQLKVDGENDALVRNSSNDALIEIFGDLRYAKGTGEVFMYSYYLNKNGFSVYNASIQIERICHTVKTEMEEFRME